MKGNPLLTASNRPLPDLTDRPTRPRSLDAAAVAFVAFGLLVWIEFGHAMEWDVILLESEDGLVLWMMAALLFQALTFGLLWLVIRGTRWARPAFAVLQIPMSAFFLLSIAAVLLLKASDGRWQVIAGYEAQLASFLMPSLTESLHAAAGLSLLAVLFRRNTSAWLAASKAQSKAENAPC